MKTLTRWMFSIVIFGVTMLSSPQQRTAPTPAGDWPMYNRDLAASRYSPLTQINTENVGRLVRAWNYKLPNKPGGITGGWEYTPIVINGMMYVVTNNAVLALEAETGKEIWTHEMRDGQPSRRGVAYWPSAAGVLPRIFFTSGKRLIALNAYTGEAPLGFGRNGEIEMAVSYESAPAVYLNLLITGSNGKTVSESVELRVN